MTKKTPRIWFITGADKGLGYSAAKAALAQGDRVIVTVLAPDGSHGLSTQYPDTLRAFHLDARDHDRFDEVVAQAETVFGGIDVLVNNAGYGLLAVAEATPAQKYRDMFEINFFGLAEMTRAVLPIMRRKRSGHIINLSSKAGFGASAGFAFYSASKFAVEGYSEALAMEVKHLGIHVTIIEPGGFRSDFAGPSLVSASSEEADYAATNCMIAEYVEQRHGKQQSDPAKFGPALCRLVDAKEPPLRLPLGEDSLQFIRDDIRAVSAELDRWEDLSKSTAVDE
ncbi:oxidoreductase [Caballeronia novacaledonica]|uniref:SDR family NAD(P)-dependent oxidoreductase n=1 Tax=Caballeronia novacaledonica TaxID=1544861 RepID=A0AA37ID92_9BURK|nr:oxidoreductase [Caballeronia novacaledonica]GJH27037.1 SDR family NAD(P)-dependent oxidoreductase [Caballeronia novacaledonica]